MMSNSAPSTDAKSGDGGASRDGGRDCAMSRGGMSCDGATSVGKESRITDGRHDERRGYNDSWCSGREQRRHAEPHAAERWRDEPLRGERRPHHDGRHVERLGCNYRPSIGERERDLYDQLNAKR